MALPSIRITPHTSRRSCGKLRMAHAIARPWVELAAKLSCDGALMDTPPACWTL